VSHRLAVLEVRLPPLREPTEDLPLLVGEILDRLGARGRPEAAPLGTPEVLAELARHAWPGNVRELRNFVERSLALRAQPPLVGGDAPFERVYLERLLARHDDNVSAAARAAGLDRLKLYRLLWRHGLR
jgi:DNA-binding NtrC family response regulator